MAYSSEAAKVRDMPHVMKYVVGKIADLGCGPDKITPDSIGFDGRDLEGVTVKMELNSSDSFFIFAQEHEEAFDTVFSSHFLEHLPNQFGSIVDWSSLLKSGGHMVLYLPDGRHYNNKENPEHMIDMNYDDFMFWFKRSFCGEGKDFKGNHLPKLFELVESGMDVGEDRYSFFVVSRKV